MSIISEAQTVVFGTAKARLNPLTDDWIVTGQADGSAYACHSWQAASEMLQTVDHFNKTGKVKTFHPESRRFFEQFADAERKFCGYAGELR